MKFWKLAILAGGGAAACCAAPVLLASALAGLGVGAFVSTPAGLLIVLLAVGAALLALRRRAIRKACECAPDACNVAGSPAAR